MPVRFRSPALSRLTPLGALLGATLAAVGCSGTDGGDDAPGGTHGSAGGAQGGCPAVGIQPEVPALLDQPTSPFCCGL